MEKYGNKKYLLKASFEHFCTVEGCVEDEDRKCCVSEKRLEKIYTEEEMKEAKETISQC